MVLQLDTEIELNGTARHRAEVRRRWEVLAGYVDEYIARTGEKKATIASHCNYTASGFAHVLAGKQPRDRERVKAIAQAIELDVDKTNELLRSAAMADLAVHEIEEVLATQEETFRREATSDRLLEARLDAVLDEQLRDEWAQLQTAWAHVRDMRAASEERRWTVVFEGFGKALRKDYGYLRRSTARFLAHLHRLDAEAKFFDFSPPGGRLSMARTACLQGLNSAEVAGDDVSTALLYRRLADIERRQGALKAARDHYARALKMLDQLKRHQSSAIRKWAEHQQARLRRHEANCALLQGLPLEPVIAELAESLEYFTKEQDLYEIAQTKYTLAWARSLTGNWNEGLRLHQQGLEDIQDLNRSRKPERRDYRSLLQGYLYLGDDYLQRGRMVEAKELLDQALEIAKGVRDAEYTFYHDIARVYLVLGQWFRLDNQLDNAGCCVRRGIEIYQTYYADPVRLAMGDLALGHIESAAGDISAALQHYKDARLRLLPGIEPRLYSGLPRTGEGTHLSDDMLTYAEPSSLFDELEGLEQVKHKAAINPYYEVAARYAAVRVWIVDHFEEANLRIARELVSIQKICTVHNYDQWLARILALKAIHMAQRGCGEAETHPVVEAAFESASLFNTILVDRVRRDFATHWPERAQPISDLDRLAQRYRSGALNQVE